MSYIRPTWLAGDTTRPEWSEVDGDFLKCVPLDFRFFADVEDRYYHVARTELALYL